MHYLPLTNRIDVEAFFTVNEQTELFLLSVIMGAVFGIIYDVFRTLRTAVPLLKARLPTAICDAAFMIICALGIYIFSLTFARGEIRFYYVLGAALGMIIYLMTAGTVVIGIIRTVFGAVYGLMKKILSFVFRPAGIIFKKIRIKIYGIFIQCAEKFKGKSKSNKKDLKNIGEKVYNVTNRFKRLAAFAPLKKGRDCYEQDSSGEAR